MLEDQAIQQLLDDLFLLQIIRTPTQKYGHNLNNRITSLRIYPTGSESHGPHTTAMHWVDSAQFAEPEPVPLANVIKDKAQATANTFIDSVISTAHVEVEGDNVVHYEHEQYYFHNDHLGGSRYITDEHGDVYEHNEYFPGGEGWINATLNSNFTTPYRFTGKEQDAQTGLYYYGARYYDPRGQVWLSTDPILEKYLDGAVGGVYASSNMALFSYGRNNPVTLKDPDGNIVPLLILAAKGVSYGLAIHGAYDTGHAIGTGMNDVATGQKTLGEAALGTGKEVAIGVAMTVTGTKALKHIPDSVKDKVSEVTEKAKDKVESAVDKVEDSAKVPKGGDVTKRPSSFRKKTVQDAWDNAAPGSKPGSKACPTCGKDVDVAPGQGRRDWDVDHQPP